MEKKDEQGFRVLTVGSNGQRGSGEPKRWRLLLADKRLELK
jgi:hypothetical protein